MKNTMYCEPCDESVEDASHFNDTRHVEFVELLAKFGIDYFQPFAHDRTGEIGFFSWRSASPVPRQLVVNNPQLLTNQWIIVQNAQPDANWKLVVCDIEFIKSVLNDIPREQLAS
jgi:hypothetical protein